MSNHTPGPWNVCERVWAIDDRHFTKEQLNNMYWVGKRPGVAVALVDGSEDTQEEAAANARLIAQAPAMLEALIELWEAGEWVWSEADQATVFRITLAAKDQERLFIETAKNLTNAFGD